MFQEAAAKEFSRRTRNSCAHAGMDGLTGTPQSDPQADIVVNALAGAVGCIPVPSHSTVNTSRVFWERW